MNELLSVLGFWGPYILILTTTYSLIIYDLNYVNYYLLFTIFGSIFNHIVKDLIKQPRPKRQRYLYDFEKDKKNGVYTGAQTYGMPSGHAQSSFYSMFTVLFTVPNNYIKLGSILIACNTCWQRWVYRNHTIIQILIGSLCGIFIFCCAFKFSKINFHSLI